MRNPYMELGSGIVSLALQGFRLWVPILTV